MRIGNDHATIAPVTLDDKENANKERGRLLRALARVHCSTATSYPELGGKPGPSAQIQIPPAGLVDTADALTRCATQPQAAPSATAHDVDDALRRALTSVLIRY